MKATILSLNTAHPRAMEFDGKTIQSSMLKDPVIGPLKVSTTTIEGDSFANPKFHGTPDSVLYALGLKQALEIMQLMGRHEFFPGHLGENLTLDSFDENEVSVGDTFKIGGVIAQATFPRIPCGKVNFRLCHSEGKALMERSGRSGVYFRILQPGEIAKTDLVERISRAQETFLVGDVYRMVLKKEKWSADMAARAAANGAFPVKFMADLKTKIENG